MIKLRIEILVLILALAPGQGHAYIGPGGGLSLLTTALAMLAAFSVSTVVVLTWPLRALKRWLRRRRGEGGTGASDGAPEDK